MFRYAGTGRELTTVLFISSRTLLSLCNAGVAELVDALVLGTSGESRGGSSPSARTTRLYK